MNDNPNQQENLDSVVAEPGGPAASVPRWLAPCVLLLVFAGLFYARLPFLNNPLVGEETYFAYLAINNGIDPPPPGHKYLHQARVRGRMHFIEAEHPVPPYLFITRVLRPLFGRHADFTSLTFDQKSRAGRLPFFIVFCAALLVLMILAGLNLRGAPFPPVLAVGGLILFGLSTPLAVGASIQPQVDGAVGVLWVALAALALHAAALRHTRAAAAGLGALAGFVACMGKNEWAMTLAVATLVSFPLAWLASRLMRNAECGMRNGLPDTHNSKLTTQNSQLKTHAWPLAPRPWPLLLGLLAGLAAGSLVAYLFDPYNYTHGLDVMRRTQQATSAEWAKTFLLRLPWIWPVLILGLVGALAGIVRWRILFTDYVGGAVLLLWCLAMLAGFLASSWPGDFFPRYFCPAAFGLVCFLAAWLPRLRLGSRLGCAIFCITLILSGLNAWKLRHFHVAKEALGSAPGKSLVAQRRMIINTANRAVLSSSPLITDLNFGYYYPELDFIADFIPEDRVESYLRH